MTVDLADSSILIDYLRGITGPARDHVARSLDQMALPVTTEPVTMELLAGVTTHRQMAAVELLLDAMAVLPVRPDTDYRDAASIYRAVRATGQVVRNMNDCLIAAVAQRHGARVVHRDRDFEAIAAVMPLRTLDLR